MIRALAVVVLCAGAASADEDGETARADTERGASLFSQCRGCHEIGEGARNRIGPHLNGIFGRHAASVDGFAYSRSLKRAGADGLVWTAETLDAFIADPRSLATRTRMSYRGMKDARDRADLMAFLRLQAGGEAEAADAAGETDDAAARPELSPEVLAIEGDAEFGEYLSSECTTCHRADGADAGIPSITLWPEEDFVIAMHAYKQKLRPHPVMQMMAGRLSDEEIAALAAYFARLDE